MTSPIKGGSAFAQHRFAPSGPLLPSEEYVVREGYDAVVELIEIPAPAFFGEVYPRNIASDPLQVVFNDFKIGNVLRMDVRVSAQLANPIADPAQILGGMPAISLDGGATFFLGQPGSFAQQFATPGAAALTVFWAAIITDPMPVTPFFGGSTILVPVKNPPIVRVVNTSDGDMIISSSNDPGECGAMWLTASEINVKRIFQAPPGVLLAMP